MRHYLTAGAIGALVICGVAQAQYSVHWPAPVAATNAGQSYHLPMGTPIALVTRTQISSKSSKAGDRVYFDVAESIAFRGQVVVPVGAIAVGEVVRSDRNGHFGKKGKVDVRLLYAETPHGPVRLSGQTFDRGKSGVGPMAVAVVAVGVFGFLVHGTSATIPHGTAVTAYFAEPLRFAYQPEQASLATVQADPRPVGVSQN